MTFETFDQSDEGTWPDQQKYNDKDKYKDKGNNKDNGIDIRQSQRLVTFETLITILTIECLNS